MIQIEHEEPQDAAIAKVEELVRRSEVRTNESRPFLTAEWKNLAMLNYAIDPAALAPFVPAGTLLDLWDGKTFVSIVGFLFLEARVFGIPIPFHRTFEEVNMRFYVRRKSGEGWRRGVVFIKEIVPRATIAMAARNLYNEPYVTMPMAHRAEAESGSLKSMEYSWRHAGRQESLKVTVRGQAQALLEGSEAEFITEHHWGYNAQRDGSTLEYRVEHPSWRIYEASDAELNCDVAGLYGERFCDNLDREPSSAFLAAGSAVTVFRGKRLTR